MNVSWLIDPFALQLAAAANSMPKDSMPGEDPAIMQALPAQFHQACHMCLGLADWTNKLQFRSLQTLAILGPYLW